MSGVDGTEPVTLLERQGDVLIVTLNRPDALNALNRALLDALSAAWHEAADPAVRAVVVTGAGRGFCAGADLRASQDGGAPGTSTLRHTYHPHTLALVALEKPVIAAVNGAAAGAGLSMACAADIRIAAPEAKFVPAFAKIGLIPDSGGTWLIPRLLGYSRAFDWLTSARPLSAEEAQAWGLVSEIVPGDQLVARAVERAQQLAAMPGRALGLTKQLLLRSSFNTLAQQLEDEQAFQVLAMSDPARAAARAAMVEKISAERSASPAS